MYDFFTHNAPLVSDGDYYSSEDVFTALPYAKGRRYFDAVALPKSLFLVTLFLYGKAGIFRLEMEFLVLQPQAIDLADIAGRDE